MTMTARSTGAAAILAAALAASLAGCNAGERPNPDAPRYAAPTPANLAYCPPTLDYIREDLVTPEDRWEDFLGPGVMQKTLNKPIDEMITEGGGYQASVDTGERYVAQYQGILDDQANVAEQHRTDGMSDEWIATYLMSVRDGVTINQAFLDAVECRRRNGSLEALLGPNAIPPQP
jgi:hypothetical protein